jgi:hypothetical protein
MAVTIPEVEPTELRAGETWAWKRSYADYSATGWTLTYTAINAAGKITLVATATGTAHLVSVPAISVAASTGVPAVVGTDSFAAGTYTLYGKVSDGTSVYSVYDGLVTVAPDLAAASTYDTRSTAKKLLEALDAYLLDKASKDQLDVIETALADRRIRRDKAALLKWRSELQIEVAREDAAANGQNAGRYYVRFARA